MTRASPGTRSHMATEIEEQPALIRALAARWQVRADELRPRLLARRQLIVVGRGSSGNAATFATYLSGLERGRQAIELRPWLTTRTEPADHADAAAIAYSVSGRSTDVAHAAAWLKRGGAFVVGVTNAVEPCVLEATVDEVARLDVGPELAIPATKTFNAQLLVSAALCGHNVADDASDIADAMEAVLAQDVAAALTEFLRGARHVVIVARGLGLAAALDGALKLQETARVAATAFSAAELMHGPIGALVQQDRAVLLDDGAAESDSLDAALVRLLAKRTPALVLAPADELGRGHRPGALHLPLPRAIWARPSLFALVLQLVALRLAEEQGLDPDAPAHLSKVTAT